MNSAAIVCPTWSVRTKLFPKPPPKVRSLKLIHLAIHATQCQMVGWLMKWSAKDLEGNCHSLDSYLGKLYVHVTVHHNKFLCNKTNPDAPISQIYFVMKLYMFRTVRLPIIRSLFNVHSAVVYVIQVCRQLSSRTIPGPARKLKAVYKPVWHIPLLSVHWINSWWWADELSETCRVSWQNKFVKLVHLVGVITEKSYLGICKVNE